MKPMLKAPGTKRLKLKYDQLLSILLQFCFNFAFSFNLRRYMKAVMGVLRTHQAGPEHMFLTRGLHSSTFRLDVSTFCGLRWVITEPRTAQDELSVDECKPLVLTITTTLKPSLLE